MLSLHDVKLVKRIYPHRPDHPALAYPGNKSVFPSKGVIAFPNLYAD